ncbi:hypothetical protein ACP70R_020818 [Stipagrostis hirtigluma subsp. patula]
MSPTSPWQPAGAGAARHAASAAAVKVHRDSHGIHKASSPPLSSSSTNSSVSSSSNAAPTITNNSNRPAPAPRQRPPQQQPVIIYTHSPKVIRTNPRDFMSIVQKLTGLDSPGAAARAAPPAAPSSSVLAAAAAQDESSSSSSESCANASHAQPAPPPRYADPQLMPPPPAAPIDAHFMPPDIPLFAPGASDMQLCSPRGLYGQFLPADAAALGHVMSMNMNSAGGNGGAVFSPSMVDSMRSFPDY